MKALSLILISSCFASLWAQAGLAETLARGEPASPCANEAQSIQIEAFFQDLWKATRNIPKPIPRTIPRTIQDSIVSNLSCADLSDSSLLKAVRKERFTPEFQLKIENFSTEKNDGHCWALSRAQRLFSYLARTDVSSSEPLESDKILDMIERYVSEQNDFAENPGPEIHFKKPEVFNFPLTQRSFKDGQFDSLWQLKFRKPRNLFSALESNQSALPIGFENFWRSVKVDTAQFFSRGRDVKAEKSVSRRLDAALQEGWTPMMWISGFPNGRWESHTVLVQSSRKINEDVTEYLLYDSNQPEREVTLRFDRRKGFSPGNVSVFYGDTTRFDIVDEGERADIVRALREYYSKKCKE